MITLYAIESRTTRNVFNVIDHYYDLDYGIQFVLADEQGEISRLDFLTLKRGYRFIRFKEVKIECQSKN